MHTLFSLSRSATSSALDISELVLVLFGVLLVVGLVGEYAKSERWKRHVKVFEMFVILGVAGELFADGGIFLFSKRLQIISDREIAKARSSVGLTQQLLSARSIENPDALIKELKQFKGLPIVLRSYAGDAEGFGLCATLSGIMKSAEINLTNECGKVPITEITMTGITIAGPDQKIVLLLDTAIIRQDLLSWPDVQPTSATAAQVKTAPFTVFVGVKAPITITPGPDGSGFKIRIDQYSP
jgi:hypothetical protein